MLRRPFVIWSLWPPHHPHLCRHPFIYMLCTSWPPRTCLFSTFPSQDFYACHFLCLKCPFSKYLSGLLLISLPSDHQRGCPQATLYKIAVLASFHLFSQYPCLALFFHSIYHYLELQIYFSVDVCLLTLECKLHESRDFVLFLLYPQTLDQCLAYARPQIFVD